MTSTAHKRFWGKGVIARALAGLAMMSMGIVAAGLPATATRATSTATAPATQVKTMPALPTVNVDVTEWVVFVTEASSKELNRREGFENTLPSFVNDSRKEPAPSVPSASPTTQAGTMPAPVGIIRITPTGRINTDVAIDVQLSYKNGRILGHWPPAKPRPTNLLWQDVHFAAGAEKPRALPEGLWLSEARSAATPTQMLTCGTITEPFLLYDFELNYDVALQVTGGENGKYKVAHAMAAPMQNLTLYKLDASGKWRTGTLETLNKSGPVPATSTAPSATSTMPATTVKAERPTTRVLTTVRRGPNGSTEEKPETPSTPPVLLVSTNLTLGDADATAETVFASWQAKLTTAGVSTADQKIIMKILAKYALDPKRLTAIYQLDPAEFDKLLPLEIVPQPKKVSRIALVVVTGIDPAMGDELAQWIAQLGDKSWEKREAAMAEIQKIGSRAKQQLEKATKEKDLEIAYRAEQLLQVISNENPDKPNQ